MIRTTVSTICLFFSISLCAQNVGINTQTPSEKLDVNGNINLGGNLKVNNVAGTPGQVLRTNNSGSTEWGEISSSEFKNVESFILAGAGNWIAPAGVTRIVVELYGAGGGGNVHAGGGGGGYLRAYFTVVPSTSYSFTVGSSGNGATTANGTTGGSTSITVGGVTVSANGGQGAQYISAALGFGGNGGGITVPIGYTSYFALYGQPGSPIKKAYWQYDATTFYQTGENGKGGDAGYTVNTGGGGGAYVGNTTANTMVEQRFLGVASVPGGGGGSGYNFGGQIALGGTGATGMVVVRY